MSETQSKFIDKLNGVLSKLPDLPPELANPTNQSPSQLNIRQQVQETNQSIQLFGQLLMIAERVISSDFDPSGKSPLDFAMLAASVCLECPMSGAWNDANRQRFYLCLGRAILHQSVRILEAKCNPSLLTDGREEDATESTLQNVAAETKGIESDDFLTWVSELNKLQQRNRSDFTAPFLLHWFAGRSKNQIAELLDWPLDNVEKRIDYVATESGFPFTSLTGVPTAING